MQVFWEVARVRVATAQAARQAKQELMAAGNTEAAGAAIKKLLLGPRGQEALPADLCGPLAERWGLAFLSLLGLQPLEAATRWRASCGVPWVPACGAPLCTGPFWLSALLSSARESMHSD
jgi:hypothetical protein